MLHSETLTRAGKLMKSRALAATASPWHATPVWSSHAVSTSAVYSHAHPAGSVASEVIASGRIRNGYGGTRNPHDVVHIAGMQPAVALLIADWLERNGKYLADAGESYSSTDEPGAMRDASTIAFAYLADATGATS